MGTLDSLGCVFTESNQSLNIQLKYMLRTFEIKNIHFHSEHANIKLLAYRLGETTSAWQKWFIFHIYYVNSDKIMLSLVLKEPPQDNIPYCTYKYLCCQQNKRAPSNMGNIHIIKQLGKIHGMRICEFLLYPLISLTVKHNWKKKMANSA